MLGLAPVRLIVDVDGHPLKFLNEKLPWHKDLKITRLELLMVKPRFMFLKMHTNQDIVGYGEPTWKARLMQLPELCEQWRTTCWARSKAD